MKKKTQRHSQMSMQFLNDICGGAKACLTDDKESAKKLQARCSVIEGFFPKTPTARLEGKTNQPSFYLAEMTRTPLKVRQRKNV